jgi:formylglycine-generating enzyme required for sulfatase activity
MTVAIVLAVGLLLFNRPLIEMFFPEVSEAEAAPIVVLPSWEPDWVTIPAGTFHVGEPFDIPDEEIESLLELGVETALVRRAVTNARWFEFLMANEAVLTTTNDDGEMRWGDEFIPRFAFGWGRVGVERRPVMPNGEGGNPGPDDIVEDVEFDEALEYFRWLTSMPEYHIGRRNITHENWMSFLVKNETTLREDGVFEECIPGPGSGWHANATGGMPSPPIQLIEYDAEWMPVEGVGDRALEYFDVWVAGSPYVHVLWPPAVDDSERIPNWLWMAFLDETEEELVEAEVWAEAVPGPESGWTLDPFFGPAMPTYPWGEIDGGTLSGVGIEAVRRYHDWASRHTITYDFEISRYEVTNALWRDFLEEREAELRRDGLFEEAMPGDYGGWILDETGRYAPPSDALDLPVRNVSVKAANRFGDYLTDRLNEPGTIIRLPTDLEWEYAARGKGWRSYTWGHAFLLPSAVGTGDPKPPIGIYDRRPLPVDSVDPDDRSELGVVGLGTNVSELVEHWERDRNRKEFRPWSELRGASFKDPVHQARVKARVWNNRKIDHRTRWPDVGVRLVKVTFPDLPE